MWHPQANILPFLFFRHPFDDLIDSSRCTDDKSGEQHHDSTGDTLRLRHQGFDTLRLFSVYTKPFIPKDQSKPFEGDVET